MSVNSVVLVRSSGGEYINLDFAMVIYFSYRHLRAKPSTERDKSR